MYSIKHLRRWIYTRLCIFLAEISGFGKNVLRSKSYPPQQIKIILLISRQQDIELLIDVYARSQKRDDIEVAFWTTKRVIRRYPEILNRLAQYNIKPDFMVGHNNLLHTIVRLYRMDALLTTVESTLAAHKIPFILTEMSNAAGIHTYTMQHGYGNVGLTYLPEVRFSAKKIFIWGLVEKLPAFISDDTRRKCIAVGRPKVHLETPTEQIQRTDDKPIIVVFESLHGDQFDDDYSARFFSDLQHVAQRFPQFRFVLKPHPSVLVREPLHLRSLASLDGIEVLGQQKTEFAHWTAHMLLANAVAAITVPSTVALDAALTGTPVAMTRYGQKHPYYEYYKPLPMLDNGKDWQNFLNNVSNNPAFLEPVLETFLKEAILPGNAADRILNEISSNVNSMPIRFLPKSRFSVSMRSEE